MTQKPDKKELQRRAAEDLAKKLQLEVFLRADMIRFFKKISSAARLLYESTGRSLTVIHYRDDLQPILAKHYRRVIKQFQNPLRIDMNQGLGITKASQDDDELSDEDEQYVDNQSHQQALIILTTAQNRVDNTLNKAKVAQHTDITEAQTAAQAAQANGQATPSSLAGSETAAQQGEEGKPTGTLQPAQTDAQTADAQSSTAHQNNAAVAAIFAADFDADSEGSADTIATTETQQTAETAKQNSVQSTVSGSINAGDVAGAAAIIATISKTWHGMLDSRERPWHVEAEGQTQSLNDPFVVNGEQLMYPGDMSLGASAGNIINCRCGAQYF